MGKEIAPRPGQEAPPARRHGVAGVLESPRKAIHARHPCQTKRHGMGNGGACLAPPGAVPSPLPRGFGKRNARKAREPFENEGI